MAEGGLPRETVRTAWLNLAILAAIVLSLYFLYTLRSVVTAFFLSALLAYLLDPVADWLERRHLPRGLGVILLILVLALFGVVVVTLVFPILRVQLESLIEGTPRYLEQLRPWLEPVILRLTGIDPFELEGAWNDFFGRLWTLPPSFFQSASSVLWRASTGLVNFILLLINLAIIPVATFYLLRDFDHLKERALHLAPPKHHAFLGERFRRMDEILGSFLKGQFLVALILAGIYSLGLVLLGTPLGIVIGIAGGLANIVPYMGLLVGLLPALLMTLLEHPDWPHALGVLVVFGFGQGLDSMLLSPWIVGDRVGLHPVVIMMAVFIGGAAFGFLGILLAVPTAAVLKVWWETLAERYRETDFYQAS